MNSAIDALIDHWKNYQPQTPGVHIHQEDSDNIPERMWSEVRTCDVDTYLRAKTQRGIHTALHPVPYMGNLRKADLYLLMINPSVAIDSYGTQSKPQFQNELASELEHKRSCCLALDPDFWWTSWFTYYSRLFAPTLRLLLKGFREKDDSYTYRDVLTNVAPRVAILELVPYFSETASDVNAIADQLRSTQLAREAARDICEKADKGQATVLIRWSDKEKSQDRWKLDILRQAKNVYYSSVRNGISAPARSAMLDRLKSDYLHSPK